MRTLGKISLVILAMAAVAWAGNQQWKKKAYQDWSQQEANEVLNNSPWVKSINVSQTWRPEMMSMGGGPQMGGAPMGNGSQMGNTSMGNSSRGGNTGGGSMAQDNGMPEGPPPVQFEARWVSSQTMREAVARLDLLDGKISQPNAEKLVSEVPTTYQVIVFGRDMTPFAKAEEADLTKASYLQLDGPKGKIPASSVTLMKDPGGKAVTSVMFNFPRSDNGNPTIPANEKGMDLVCKTKIVTLKFHFDTRKMVGPNGPDL